MNKKNHTCSCNCERVKVLEERIEKLSEALADHLAQRATVFWSWNEIAAYCRRPTRTLQRYVKEQGFPATKIVAYVISSTGLIDSWLIARKQRSREKRARKETGYMKRYWESRSATNALTRKHQPTQR